jgi:hypothetical protein
MCRLKKQSDGGSRGTSSVIIFADMGRRLQEKINKVEDFSFTIHVHILEYQHINKKQQIKHVTNNIRGRK